MALDIQLKAIRSTALDVSTVVLADREVAIGTIGTDTYLCIGNGTSPASALPRVLFGQLALVWGNISGTLSLQTDLYNAINARLERYLGTTNAGRILVVGDDGTVVTIANTFATQQSVADLREEVEDLRDEFDDLEERVDNISILGKKIPVTVASGAVLQTTYGNVSTLAGMDPTVNDFVLAQDATVWSIQTIGGDGAITWQLVANFQTDVSGKMDLVTGGAAGNIIIQGVNGNSAQSDVSLTSIQNDIGARVATAQGSANANRLMGTNAAGDVITVTVVDGGVV